MITSTIFYIINTINIINQYNIVFFVIVINVYNYIIYRYMWEVNSFINIKLCSKILHYCLLIVTYIVDVF